MYDMNYLTPLYENLCEIAEAKRYLTETEIEEQKLEFFFAMTCKDLSARNPYIQMLESYSDNCRIEWCRRKIDELILDIKNFSTDYQSKRKLTELRPIEHTYTITIEETITQDFEITAYSEQEAAHKAYKKHKKGELVVENGQIQKVLVLSQGKLMIEEDY